MQRVSILRALCGTDSPTVCPVPTGVKRETIRLLVFFLSSGNDCVIVGWCLTGKCILCDTEVEPKKKRKKDLGFLVIDFHQLVILAN